MKPWHCPHGELRPLCAADLFGVVLNGPRMAFPDPPDPTVEVLIAEIRQEKQMLRSFDLAYRPPRPGKPRKSVFPQLIEDSQRRICGLYFKLKPLSIGVRLMPRGPVIPWPIR